MHLKHIPAVSPLSLAHKSFFQTIDVEPKYFFFFKQKTLYSKETNMSGGKSIEFKSEN